MTALDEVTRSAIVSPDGVYRYDLRRSWGTDHSRVIWIMLNPSTADADIDDPTIRRCTGFARSWGYDGIIVRNLFALRATDPRELRTHPDPVGPRGDEMLRVGRLGDFLVVAAWGADPFAARRGVEIRDRLAEHGLAVHHLGLTKHGAPRHPLYLPGATTPARWVAS